MARLVRGHKRRNAMTIAARSSALVLIALQGLQEGAECWYVVKVKSQDARCLDAGPHITRSRE